MSLSDSVSLGPLNLPLVLIIGVLTYGLSYLAGVLPLRNDKEERRTFGDLLSAPILPFFLGWKLSLILTDAGDVLANPLLLLYGSGGIVNILIGVAAGGLFLAFRWNRSKPETSVNKALIRGLGTALVISLAIFLVGGGAMAVTGNSSAERELLPPVPLTAEDGSSWDTSMAAGNPVVLNFWASWCPPCRAEMPMLERLQSDPRFNSVTFFAVNAVRTEKNSDDGRNWLDANEIDLPLLFDTTGEAMNRYGISSLPTTIVLDSEGRIVEIKIGTVSRSWLISAVRKAD